MDTNQTALLADIKHQLQKLLVQIDAALGELPTTNFKVTRVAFALTKHSDPMLRLTAEDGTQINAFMTQTRDDFKLFKDAGYGDRFHNFKAFDAENWTQHPIVVECRRPGLFWELVRVHPAAPGAEPDVVPTIERLPDDGAALSALKDFDPADE